MSKIFNLKTLLKPNFQKIFLLIIILSFIFLRFYQLESRMQFSWDQVDNAWVSKNLIVDRVFPVFGMPVNQGSGFNIGPLYYYIIALFYYIFNLDPIGAGVFAGIVSTVTVLIFYFIVNKIFSTKIAFFAVIIYTFSSYILNFDRIPWPVTLIPLVSMLIFYFLFKAIYDKKYLLALSCVLGFSFHIHFTSILYVFILALCAGYFFNKKSIKLLSLSVMLFIPWILPSLIAGYYNKSQSRNIEQFFNSSFHGLHLRRVMQIAKDAFIELPGISGRSISDYAYLFIPAFIVSFYKTNKKRFVLSSKIGSIKKLVIKKEFVTFYLIALWFCVPWVALSTYRGEISNYYFSLTRPVAVIIMAYVLSYIFSSKHILLKVAVLVFVGFFVYESMVLFFTYKAQGLSYYKKIAKEEVDRGIKNEFIYGAPESYLHYYFRRIKKNE